MIFHSKSRIKKQKHYFIPVIILTDDKVLLIQKAMEMLIINFLSEFIFYSNNLSKSFMKHWSLKRDPHKT